MSEGANKENKQVQVEGGREPEDKVVTGNREHWAPGVC